jgi:hypothetical protein
MKWATSKVKGDLMARRNWLQAQIRQAGGDVQQWPEWMKKVATFDGTRRDDTGSGAAAGAKENPTTDKTGAQGRSGERPDR